MPDATGLSPAEAVFLRKPNNTTGTATVKVTLLMMLAKGVLRIEETEEPGLLRSKKIAHLRIAHEPKDAPPEVATLLAAVRAAQADGGRMRDVVKRLQKEFSTNCALFNARFVIPSLLARGLLTERKILFLRDYRATPAGEAERARIEADVAKAREIPALLASDPARAAALAASLGGTLLLAEELRKHYKPLADAMRAQSGVDMSAIASLDSGTHHGDFSGGFDFGSFHCGSFDAGTLDSGMASFDASFSDAGGGDGGHHH